MPSPSAPVAAPHIITSLTVGGEAIDDPFDIDGGGASLVKITFGSLVRGQKYSVGRPIGVRQFAHRHPTLLSHPKMVLRWPEPTW